jgi:hypothetical protein
MSGYLFDLFHLQKLSLLERNYLDYLDSRTIMVKV